MTQFAVRSEIPGVLRATFDRPPINLEQLNITEARHRLARRIFFGQRGELRQDYREGMEDQLGALGLALNAVVLWNSLYLDRAA